MPFASTGVYTPPSGATDAAPGDIIRSSVWNDIFTDISDALTLLGEQVYGTTSVTAATYAPVAADAKLLVNRAGAVTINLPAASTRYGYPLLVKDASGSAHLNNITVARNGSDVIENTTSYVIDTAWGAVWLYPITGGWILLP